MAVTVLSLLALALASTPRDTIAEMAGSLAESEPVAFFGAFSRDFPRREELFRNVRALEREFEIASTVDVIESTEENGEASLDLDWSVELRPRAGTGQLVRRRERIEVKMRREGRSWRVISLQPLSFFAPR
jgi:hypothetical protein